MERRLEDEGEKATRAEPPGQEPSSSGSSEMQTGQIRQDNNDGDEMPSNVNQREEGMEDGVVDGDADDVVMAVS